MKGLKPLRFGFSRAQMDDEATKLLREIREILLRNEARDTAYMEGNNRIYRTTNRIARINGVLLVLLVLVAVIAIIVRSPIF
jgi:hypothetical protein